MYNRDRRIRMLYCIFIFAFTCVFFTVIHPLSIFNADDWLGIATNRHLIPQWGRWNPTRVLPEALLPLCGSIASYFVYPLLNNYIGSVALVNGVVVAFFIAVYMYMYGELLRKKWQIASMNALLLSSLFFIGHFLIFRSKPSENVHMFLAPDVTCYFYYVIPNLLNACFVMYFMRNDILDKLGTGMHHKRLFQIGLLLAAMYFALLSNVYASVMLAAYVGAQLLFELGGLIQRKIRFRECVRKNVLRLAYMLLWLAVQVFEINGGRVDSLNVGVSLISKLRDTLGYLGNTIAAMNKSCVLLAAVVVFAAAALVLYERRKRRSNPFSSENREEETVLSNLPTIVVAGMLCALYVIIVCSQHEASYIERMDILFGPVFYGFIVLTLCLVHILKKKPVLAVILPLLICVLIFEVHTSGRTFRDVNYGIVDVKTSIAISEDVVEQFIRADRDGSTEMSLFVPAINEEAGWPFPSSFGNSVSRALHKYGVVRRKISVTTVLSQDKEEQFHLDE